MIKLFKLILMQIILFHRPFGGCIMWWACFVYSHTLMRRKVQTEQDINLSLCAGAPKQSAKCKAAVETMS